MNDTYFFWVVEIINIQQLIRGTLWVTILRIGEKGANLYEFTPFYLYENVQFLKMRYVPQTHP